MTSFIDNHFIEADKIDILPKVSQNRFPFSSDRNSSNLSDYMSVHATKNFTGKLWRLRAQNILFSPVTISFRTYCGSVAINFEKYPYLSLDLTLPNFT